MGSNPQVALAADKARLKALHRKPRVYAKRATLAADSTQRQSDRKHAPPTVRLLDKAEIRQITGVSFTTIWKWMRKNHFPRCYAIGHGEKTKSVWRSDDIDRWIDGLKVRKLKGHPPPDQTIKEPEPA